MRTPDNRTARHTPARWSQDAAWAWAARGPAGRVSPPRRAKAARFAAAAGGLALAACSGISRVEETCATQRATAATYAACLRSNHAMLTSGPPAERDLAMYYLATAEEQEEKVARGEATNAQAMRELARFRATELAKLEQERHEAALKQWTEFMQNYNKDKASGSSGGASAQPVSSGGRDSVLRNPRW